MIFIVKTYPLRYNTLREKREGGRRARRGKRRGERNRGERDVERQLLTVITEVVNKNNFMH